MRLARASVTLICALVTVCSPFAGLAQNHKISTNAKNADSNLPELEPSGKNLARKTEPISVSYWIELTRDGKSFRANNKSPFHSGDEIKLHVISNVDNGHACVILRNGTDGAGAVLFPDSKHGDDDRVFRKHDNVIPEFDPFVFDKNPGVEQVRLVVSREAIDPKSFLMTKTTPAVNGPLLVAMNPQGKKDLVPSNVQVDYERLHASKETFGDSGLTAVQPAKGADFTDGQLIAYEPAHSGKAFHAFKSPAVEHSKGVKMSETKKHVTSSAKPVTSMSTKTMVPYSKGDVPPGTVTVALKDSASTLAIDIALQHLQ